MKSLLFKTRRVHAIICAFTLLIPTVASSDEEPALEIVHFWKSESERKALEVIADRYRSLGGEWIERHYPQRKTLREQMIVRLREGFPPMAIQWNPLIEPLNNIHNAGLLTTLESLESDQLLDKISPDLREFVSVDGDTVALPVSIHAANAAYYNRSIMEQFGFEPPTDWATFFSQMKTLQEAKVPSIAIGTEWWEHWLVLNNMFLAHGGQELYFSTRISGVVPPHLKADLVASMQDFIEFQTILGISGVTTNSWNEASLEVARGSAAVQIMGDWAKGEMMVAGFSLDTDFICAMAPGNDRLFRPVIVSFVLPRSEYEQDIEAQKRLVRIVLDADIQQDFAQHKGSMPVVKHNEDDHLDGCNRYHQKIIEDHGFVLFSDQDQPNPAVDKAVIVVVQQIMDGTIDDAAIAANKLIELFDTTRGL